MVKFFNLVSFVTLISASAIILLIIYWLVYPYKVLTFDNGNAVIENKVVYSGEFVKMRQRSCKHIDIPSIINRQFVDAIIYTVPTTYTKRPLGCHDTTEFVYVPMPLPAGKYFIRTNISYQVNPIRTVSYTVDTDHFTVIEATSAARLRN